MINGAHISLAGYVATDPSFRLRETGTSTASLRVAYTPRRINRDTGEWADGQTSFVSVYCYRALADNVAMCLRKGEPVVVQGRLRVRPYEKDGIQRISVEVDADAIGHDLNRGVAHFSRTRRSPGETAAELATVAAGDVPVTNGAAADGGTEEPASLAEPVGAGAPDALADAADGALEDQAMATMAQETGEVLSEAPSPF